SDREIKLSTRLIVLVISLAAALMISTRPSPVSEASCGIKNSDVLYGAATLQTGIIPADKNSSSLISDFASKYRCADADNFEGSGATAIAPACCRKKRR